MSAGQPTLVDLARRIRRPTLFLPGFPAHEPEESLSLPPLRERVLALAAGRALTFKLGTAFYPDFEPCPQVSVYADGEWIALIAGPWDEAAQAGARDMLARAA